MKKRHETLLKAFGCLEQYKQTRLKVTKYRLGNDSIKIPNSNIQKYCLQPNPFKILPSSINSINNNSKNNIISIDNDVNKDYIRTESENLSDESILQEIHFNYGKTFCELKLYHIAVKHFKLALALVDQNPWLSPDKYSDQFNGKNNNTDNNDNENTLTKKRNKKNEKNNINGNNSSTLRSTQGTSHLHVTREAAHNLVLIYKKSGAHDLALEIMQKYLVF